VNEDHAAFARREFEKAGVAGRIDLRVGAALDVLPRLARELGPDSVDLAFLDAVKTEYAQYVRLLKPLLRAEGLLVADNALGSSFWIDDPPGSSPERDAIDAFNRMVAADPGFVTACVPIREGVLIARRIR
jgi:predicted O-methyltransferase YrrM